MTTCQLYSFAHGLWDLEDFAEILPESQDFIVHVYNCFHFIQIKDKMAVLGHQVLIRDRKNGSIEV
jgi:hypothetical protein